MAPVVKAITRSAAGIVFALPIEAGRFADRVGETRRIEAAGLTLCEGILADRHVAWVVGGVNAEHARRACQLLIDGHRPRLIVSAGFAGAVAPGIVRGTAVRPRRVVRQGSEPIDLAADESDERLLTIVSVDRVVPSVEEKRRLAEEMAADVVDLETWEIASTARASGVPCLCLKVISDAAADELPAEVAGLAEAASPWRRLGAALRTVSRRPAAVADLWTLWERAVVDSRTLAGELERTISLLPSTSA